ncbi:MAG: hypothetical protein JST33_11510 [Actinobacteria bacterium]|nr:hypothetical protein [Actinomycetota bacterium]
MRAGDDGVRVQVIRGSDGVDRVVVYINGTGSASHGLFTVGSNAQLMLGEGNKTLDYVRGIVAKAAADHPGAEIMLAGYSQGGIVAQRLAQEHQFPISTVVTFGSPRLPSSGLGGIDVVRLEHNGDPIPGTDLEGVLAGEVDAANAANAHAHGGSDVVFRGGNPFQGSAALSGGIADGASRGARGAADAGVAAFAGIPVPGVREAVQLGAATIAGAGGGIMGAVQGAGAGFLAGNAHVHQPDYVWLADQFDKSGRVADTSGREALRRFEGQVVDDQL